VLHSEVLDDHFLVDAEIPESLARRLEQFKFQPRAVPGSPQATPNTPGDQPKV
jgi:hypothetical protein